MAEKSKRPPSREGKVALTVYIDEGTKRALKIAAATHDATIEGLVQEALAQVLKKYGAKQK